MLVERSVFMSLVGKILLVQLTTKAVDCKSILVRNLQCTFNSLDPLDFEIRI